eukprot:scaffold30310_cov50-Cyclotella_meneghiniana.AAC.2
MLRLFLPRKSNIDQHHSRGLQPSLPGSEYYLLDFFVLLIGQLLLLAMRVETAPKWSPVYTVCIGI